MKIEKESIYLVIDAAKNRNYFPYKERYKVFHNPKDAYDFAKTRGYGSGLFHFTPDTEMEIGMNYFEQGGDDVAISIIRLEID